MEDSSEESTLAKHEKKRTENHLNAFGQLNMESETYTYMKGKGESNGKTESDNRKKSMSTEYKETKEKICETNERELNTHTLEKSGNNDLHGTKIIENITVGKKAMNETIKPAEPIIHLKENKKENNLSLGSETTAGGRIETKMDIPGEEKDSTDDKEQHKPVGIRKDDNFTKKREKEIVDENSKPEENVDNCSDENEQYGIKLKGHTKTQFRQKEPSMKHVGPKTETERGGLNISVKKKDGTNVESSTKVSNETELQTNEKEKSKLNEKVGPEIRQEKIKKELLCDDQSISSLDAAQKVLIGLRYLAKGDLLSEVADLHGVSRTSAYHIINRFVDAVNDSFDNIRFPSGRHLTDVKQGFYQKCRIHNTVGAVDGTLIPISAPLENEEVYVCRKNFHALNVQAVVDHKARFIDIVSMWPGSTHDASSFENCGLKRGQMGHLLGDSGYALKKYLLTPLLNPATDSEEAYNQAHSSGRMVVERTFGLLKSRFRCLHRTGGVLYRKPGNCCKIVVACARLHNLCMDRNIPLPQDNPLNVNLLADGEEERLAANPDVFAVAYRQHITDLFN